jgi:S1-C subfamily serine protease
MKLAVRTLCFAALLGTLSWASAADEKADLKEAQALQTAMEKAIARAEPSVACILVARGKEQNTFKPESADFIPESYGSGVVIDEKGLLLTNEHVVRGATGLYVRLPGNKGCYAKLLASDERSDLAVLELDKKILPVKAIPLGDGGKVRKGQFVLSVANPFAAGFEDGSPSASWGIISNLRRRGPLRPHKEPIREEDLIKPLHYYGTLIQTDARLNLGCSGGALINLRGELIGLTTALAALGGSETPGGFALPIDAGMKRIIDKLKKGEEVEYGFLGVRFPPPDGRRGEGVRIDSAIPGGPAFKADMRGGCTILSIDGARVYNYSDCFLLIGTQLAGTTVRVEWRPAGGGPIRAENVALAKSYVPKSKFFASKKPSSVGGLRVDYASVLAMSQQDSPYGIPDGVVIREVVPKSAADKARLQVNKVITRVNDRKVSNPAEFYREVDNAGATVELTLLGREDKVRLTK